MLDLKAVDPSWTLFLDRDGVINHEKKLDYIYHYGEFTFYDGVLEALHYLAACFGKIIIVTNQRGVEKQLMTEEALINLHQSMTEDIHAAGGRIDAIFYCTSLENAHPNRKPQPGMALLAKQQYATIDFSKSIMVGNRMSDMQFGRNAGMHTVYLRTTHPDQPFPDPFIDLTCKDLKDFANSLFREVS